MGDNRKHVSDAEVELRLANFKLDILYEIIQLLPDLSDPERTLAFVMDRIFSLVEMEGASILTLDETGEKLVFRVVRGEKESELTGAVMDADKGIAGKVVSTGKPVLIEDTEKDKEIYRKIDETIGYTTRSLIAVPIKSYDRTIGVLEGVNIDAEEVKSPVQLTEVFESISSLITITLEHKRLIEDLNKELSANKRLLDVSRTVNSSLDIRDVLDAVMVSAQRLLDAEAASLLLIDSEKKNLEFYVAHGEKKNQIVRQAVPIEKGIVGHVARTGESVVCNDVSKDSRFDDSMDNLTGFKTRSALCVPMYSTEGVIGVLEVINKKRPGSFDGKDLIMLQTIANESAVAVKNALLMEAKNKLFAGAIEALAKTVDIKDEYNFGHSSQVAFYAERIARTFRPDDYKLHETISTASLIHDVGKVGIPDAVLLKRGPLNAEEAKIVRTHVESSINIINSIGMPQATLLAVKHHHERYDGGGYPDGSKGDAIPLAARILAVADAFDAMISDRPYHAKSPPEDAAAEIKTLAGKQFDPAIVESFTLAFEHGLLEQAEAGEQKAK